MILPLKNVSLSNILFFFYLITFYGNKKALTVHTIYTNNDYEYKNINKTLP